MGDRADYWVEIFKGGNRLGAGFLLTTCYVVTAFHCIESATTDNDVFDIYFQGEILLGRLHRQSPETDLALIDLSKSGNNAVVAPQVDRAIVGDGWRSPYRPSTVHACLTGKVSAVLPEYQCEGGEIVEAMQLECSQNLDNYSGYSGGPVERSDSDTKSAVLGILIEQYLDQSSTDRNPKRLPPVLFATTIAEVLRRFDCFAVGHLIDLLPSSPGKDSSESPVSVSPGSISRNYTSSSIRLVDDHIRAADAKIRALHEWQISGLLDELQVSQLKLQVATSLLSRIDGGGS